MEWSDIAFWFIAMPIAALLMFVVYREDIKRDAWWEKRLEEMRNSQNFDFDFREYRFQLKND